MTELMDEKALEKRRQRLVDAAKEVFGTDAGTILLDRLKRLYGIYTPVFSADPYEHAYAEGQRSVVLFLQQLVDYRPPTDVKEP